MAKAKTKMQKKEIDENGDDAFFAPPQGENPKFRRTAALSLPQLKIEGKRAYFLRCTRDMRQEEKFGKGGVRELDREGNPAFVTVMQVQNLEDGNLYTVLVGTIMAKLLKATGTYVGKCFEITKGDAPAGKAKPYSVFEIADPEHK